LRQIFGFNSPLRFDEIGSIGKKNHDNRNVRIIDRLLQRGKLAGQLRNNGKYRRKIEELNEIMGNLDIGEAMDHLDLDQKDFTTRNGGVSDNIHQLCIIITEAVEENNDAWNIVVDTQGNKPKNNSGKEKEKIYVSAGEWKVIMSAINHGTEVPANSRREVLMGY
jgi:hypothetical protein